MSSGGFCVDCLSWQRADEAGSSGLCLDILLPLPAVEILRNRFSTKLQALGDGDEPRGLSSVTSEALQ